jgi:hypothetical protein
MKLIKEEWWTPRTQLTTDEKGQIRLHCFVGEYQLTHQGRQQSLTITKESMPVLTVHT